MKNIIAASAAAAILVAGISTGAVAGDLINGADVKDGSLGGKDIRNGSIKAADLSPNLRKQLAAKATPGKDGVNGTSGKDGVNGQNGLNGVNGTDGADGADGADGTDGGVAGVQSDFEAKDGAVILDANSVRLTNFGTPAGASVEIVDLNLSVQATKKLTFTYALSGGAQYAAGSPRVFLQINDTYYNTFDADPSDAGTNNGNGTFTKSWTIPANGKVHNAGVVMDSGVGSIVVSNLTIDGTQIKFS